MSAKVSITVADGWFIGEDKHIRLAIKGEDGVTPQSLAGFDLAFNVRRSPSAVPVLIAKTVPDIVLFDVDPSDAITDDGFDVLIHHDDTVGPGGEVLVPPASYYLTWWKTNTPEAVLAEGWGVLQLSGAR